MPADPLADPPADPVAGLADPLAGLEPPGPALDDLYTRFVAAQATNIGFPAAIDLDFAELARFLGFMTNNLGDPRVDGDYPIHAKPHEREAVAIIADLLRAPDDDRWGYVTSGASEGTEHALHLARIRYPDAIVYHSRAAHHCVPAAIERLRMRSIVVRTTARGETDYDDLADQIDLRRHRPAVIVANIGTAATEAVDDVARITAILDQLAITRRWIHADAALAGIPLALLDADQRPPFDFTAGSDSIIVSGHKFIGSPVPYGVVIVRDHLRSDGRRLVTYTGSPNTTLSNSRSGLAALALWYALHRHGTGLRQRAADCRALADYTRNQLLALGIPAWRHPYAFTVVFPTPPAHISRTWALSAHGANSHIICTPGRTRAHIDAFIADIAAALPDQQQAVPVARRRATGRRSLTAFGQLVRSST